MAELLRWTRSFTGVMDEIPVAAHWLEAIAAGQRLPDDLVYALQVCLEELLTNIVRHGAAEPQAARSAPPIGKIPLAVDVTLDFAAGGVRMIVEDDGKPFDVASAPARRIETPLDEIEPGGLGVQLIKSFSGALSYERMESGNRVTIDFSR